MKQSGPKWTFGFGLEWKRREEKSPPRREGDGRERKGKEGKKSKRNENKGR